MIFWYLAVSSSTSTRFVLYALSRDARDPNLQRRDNACRIRFEYEQNINEKLTPDYQLDLSLICFVDVGQTHKDLTATGNSRFKLFIGFVPVLVPDKCFVYFLIYYEKTTCRRYQSSIAVIRHHKELLGINRRYYA